MPSSRKKKLPYLGVTAAFRRFNRLSDRTKHLLRAGLSGLDREREKLDTILKKLGAVRGKPGRRAKNYEPAVKSRPTDDGQIEFEMDQRSAWMLKNALEFNITYVETLRFHLYSILAVSIWGAFETYVVMMLEELYRKRPEILKSNEQLSVQDAFEHREDMLSFLIERQLGIVGHWKLPEVLDYLKKRIGFQPTAVFANQLPVYYLIRNIFAHNSGVVRPAYRKSVPAGLRIIGNELRVTKTFLLTMSRDVARAVAAVERHVDRKFYVKHVQGLRPQTNYTFERTRLKPRAAQRARYTAKKQV